MSDDQFETRRWFRRLLKNLAEIHPELKDLDRQAAFARWLTDEVEGHLKKEQNPSDHGRTEGPKSL